MIAARAVHGEQAAFGQHYANEALTAQKGTWLMTTVAA